MATSITHTTLGDIASRLESDITKMRIIVTLNTEAMKERDVALKDVKAAVTPGGCKVEVERNTVQITPQEMDIAQFNRLVLRLATDACQRASLKSNEHWSWKRRQATRANG